MPYFKVTPHPLLVEAEDAEKAALTARDLILAASSQRYQVVGPDGQVLWLDVPRRVADEDTIAQERSRDEPRQEPSKQSARPSVQPAPITTASVGTVPDRFRRALQVLFSSPPDRA